MKIALLGVKRRIDNILKKIQNPTVEILPYVYNRADNIPEIINNIKNVDCFLFTGRYPYQIAKKALNIEFPMGYLEFDETCFTTELFKLKNIPDKISIDTIDEKVIKNIYQELNHTLKKINSISLSDKISIDDIVNFHIENKNQDSSTTIFTCLFSVYDKLKSKKINAILLNHTFFSIHRGIENLIKKCYFYNSKSSYPAAGIIKISNYSELLKKYKNEFHLQKFLLDFHYDVLNFQEKISAFFIEKGEDAYYFISTRYLIEKYSNNYTIFPIVNNAYSKFLINLKIAIGYGLNPQSAFHNAKNILPLLDEKKINIAIATESGKIITISKFNCINFDTISTDSYLQEISKHTGIGITNLSKIKSFLLKKQTNRTTIFELSKELNITTRSGSRIINKLLENNYAKEIGIEQPIKGRPRRVFSINF